MVGEQAFLDLRVQAAIDAADALHQPHRVPVQVVVDQAGGVLKVQAFGQHVGGNQDARFRSGPRRPVRHWRSRCSRGEPADDFAAVCLRAAVDLVDAGRSLPPAVALEVAGGVGELGEDQHLVPFQDRSFFSSFMSALSLSSCFGSNFAARRGKSAT